MNRRNPETQTVTGHTTNSLTSLAKSAYNADPFWPSLSSSVYSGETILRRCHLISTIILVGFRLLILVVLWSWPKIEMFRKRVCSANISSPQTISILANEDISRRGFAFALLEFWWFANVYLISFLSCNDLRANLIWLKLALVGWLALANH